MSPLLHRRTVILTIHDAHLRSCLPYLVRGRARTPAHMPAWVVTGWRGKAIVVGHFRGERNVELRLGSRTVSTVHDLLGVTENDLTYRLGWALARSPALMTAFTALAIP